MVGSARKEERVKMCIYYIEGKDNEKASTQWRVDANLKINLYKPDKIRKEASEVQMLLFLSDKTKEVEGCTLMNVQTSLRRYTSISNLLYCTS